MDDDDAFLYGEPNFQAEAPKADLATNSGENSSNTLEAPPRVSTRYIDHAT